MRTNLVRRMRRAAARGVTLIEILIVLAIVGLIAGGVAFVALPKFIQAQKDTAKTNALEIRRIAASYHAEHMDQECPTAELLRDKKQIDAASKIVDPWEMPYKVECSDDDITVSSSGPDKKFGTADDIRVPDTKPRGE